MNNNYILFKTLIITACLSLCGCMEHIKWYVSDGYKDYKIEKHEFGDEPLSLGPLGWRNFRPLRVYMPRDIDVRCCCISGGYLDITKPKTNIAIRMHRFKECKDVNAISKILDVLTASRDDFKWTMSPEQVMSLRFKLVLKQLSRVNWYVEKRFDDRWLLMECSGASLFVTCVALTKDQCGWSFTANIDDANDEATKKWIWQLCRNLKIELLI